MIRIALVGIGYWGPNLLRVFNSLRDVRVEYVCDEDSKRLARFKQHYRHINFINDFRRVVEDPDIDAVAISTPVSTHYKLVRRALMNDKDVFVEKPLALNVGESKELVEVASARKRILMVGHLLVHHPAIDKLKDIIEGDRLGRIYYISCNRLNLGKIRREENVLWSLAVHDIAAIVYLLGKMPTSVEARGSSYIQKKVEDLAFGTLYFPRKVVAHFHASWLHPKKVREITIVGSKKMAVFDDREQKNKLRIIDQYIETQRYVSYEKLPKLTFGKFWFPRISLAEPLRIECQHFIDCIVNKRRPRSDGQAGLGVVKILEAAQDSMKLGKRINIK